MMSVCITCGSPAMTKNSDFYRWCLMLPTPAKFNMEPEKGGFQKEYPGVWFSVSMSKLQGCSIGIFLDPAPKDSNSGIQCIVKDDKGVPSQDSDDDFPITVLGIKLGRSHSARHALTTLWNSNSHYLHMIACICKLKMDTPCRFLQSGTMSTCVIHPHPHTKLCTYPKQIKKNIMT